jgi:hypothetical protein
MKRIIGLIFIVFTACSNQENSPKGTNQKPVIDTVKTAQKDTYTCEMDTDIHSDKPGVCPKCGMELIKEHK